MSLVGAISTFSSCNKAGSIPQFTAFLRNNPNNYTALLWRGRAYNIIGERNNALIDFDTARKTSRDPRSSIARAHRELVQQNVPRYMEILKDTIEKHPNCGEAWADYGSGFLICSPKQTNEAEQALTRAIDLGRINSETDEPWYHWANCDMGDICSEKGDNDGALKYYKVATHACDSFTKAHFGMCNCYLEKGDRQRAVQCFRKARSLNTTFIPWATLEEYERELLDFKMKNLSMSGTGHSSGGRGASGSDSGSRSGGGGGKGGGGDGNSGGSKGGGGGDDGESKWKLIQRASPCIAEFNGRIYVQSEDGTYWYTRDKASHGGGQSQDLSGAFVKVYENKRSTLEFMGSLDNNMEWIRRKHESAKIPIIKKSDLNIRRGGIKK